jgi:hypothetical protein
MRRRFAGMAKFVYPFCPGAIRSTSAAPRLDLHLPSDKFAVQHAQHIVDAFDGRAVQRHDHIAGNQPRERGGCGRRYPQV